MPATASRFAPLLFALVLAFTLAGISAWAAEDGIMPADLAAERSASGELTIIDVRSQREWRQTGIPAGAKRVTIHNPGGLEAFLREVEEAVDGDKDRPIAFICAAGGRSSSAQRLAREAGFTTVADVDEGMLGSRSGPGWIDRGLPVEDCGC